MAAPNGLANGARAFGDQAKWMMGGFGNAPMPAPYDGGARYPAADDANAYVRNNWPSDGRHLMSITRPETFYTPPGVAVPPQGREPTIGEMVDGAPTAHELRPLIGALVRGRQ
jgi:hypothetical protein